MPDRAGGRLRRAGLRLRPGGGGLPAPDGVLSRRSCAYPRRRVRRDLPAVRPGAGRLGADLQRGGAVRPRRGTRAARGPAGQGGLGGDPDEPAAEHRRYPRPGPGRARGRGDAGSGQHVRVAVPAAAAHAGSRCRGALDDQVPGRAFRRHRRCGGRRRRRARRADRVHAECDRQRRRAVRLVADAARPQDAGGPDGPALPQRDADRADAGRAPGRGRGVLPGPALAPGPQDGAGADAGVRRHGVVPAPGRSRRRGPGVRAHPAVHPGRVARRGGVADRAPGPDDACLGDRLSPGGPG